MGIVAAVMRERMSVVQGRKVGMLRRWGAFVIVSLMLGFGGGEIAESCCCAFGGGLVLVARRKCAATDIEAVRLKFWR